MSPFSCRIKRFCLFFFFLGWFLSGDRIFSQEPGPPGNPVLWLGQGEYAGVYWPSREWRTCKPEKDPRSSITVRHALTLTTGLEWQEDWSRCDPVTNDAGPGPVFDYGGSGRGLLKPPRER